MIIFILPLSLLRFLNFKICCDFSSRSKSIFMFGLTLYLAFVFFLLKMVPKIIQASGPSKPGSTHLSEEQMWGKGVHNSVLKCYAWATDTRYLVVWFTALTGVEHESGLVFSVWTIFQCLQRHVCFVILLRHKFKLHTFPSYCIGLNYLADEWTQLAI